MDVFSLVWREISKPRSFESQKNGPWDRNIQNAVDALAFRGLVEVTSLTVLKKSRIQSSYRLTKAGHVVFAEIIKQKNLREQFELAVEIAAEINRPNRGWDEIVKIVYAEPTYMAVRASGNRQQLPLNSPILNQTAYLASKFYDSWQPLATERIPKDVFVQTMFLVFDSIRNADEEVL